MSLKPRIAFLCHPYHRGGVTSWMVNAAGACSLSGWEVFFITVHPLRPFHSGKEREKMVDMLKGKGKDIRVISAGVNFTFEFGTDEFRAAIYKDLVAANVPEHTPLIVSDDISVWKAAGAIADRYPMIGVLHGDQDHYYEKAISFQDQLSICVCVSNRIKNTAAERCTRIDPARMYTIPCGIDLPVLNPLHATDGVNRLVFIGRLTDYEKRATDLPKICGALHKENISFHLDIAGSSDASAVEFNRLFKEEGVDRMVSFHGWRSKDQVQELLNKGDVLLLTSNSEGMPLVMMEALASGCGFTGTRVSGIEDQEYHPLAANCLSVYAVGDIEDAVNKIKKVLAIPVAVRQQAARELAEAEYSMATCIGRYKDAIEKIGSSMIQAKSIGLSPFGSLYSKAIALARYIKVSIMS